MNKPTYEQYKEMLMEWYNIVNALKLSARLISDKINSWEDVLNNTDELEKIGMRLNVEVQKWYAIMNDALGDWYWEQLRVDPDLPHWDTWDIILNEEAYNKQMDEDEKKFFVTMSELMSSARPYSKSKLEAENKFREKKKKNNRIKNRAAKTCRKTNQSK